MKKLLSLLSILTISGTVVPTTIAASPYQKENNSEKLLRNKRDLNLINSFSQVVITTHGSVTSSGVALNNKVYFGSYDGKVYEYDPETGSQKIVITAGSAIESSGVLLNNKVYFGSYDKKVYEYDPGTEENKVVITTKDQVNSSGVVLNNKVYFGSNDHKVYEYDPETGSQKIVIRADNLIDSSGAVLNNKVYFGSYDRNLYEYDPWTGSQKVVLTTGGRIISSGVILNNKLYFGPGSDKSVYEYEILELIEHDIINMKEQIKRGLYLYYNKKENHSSNPRPISGINLDNLIVISDLVINDNQKDKSYNLEQVINNICPAFNSTLENNTDNEQTMSTISCSKQLTETDTFQKMNGFSKSETTSITDNWSTNVNTKVTAKASSNAGVPVVLGAKLEVSVEVGGGYTWGESQNYTIADTSSSSDTEIKTTTETMTINVTQQSVKVPPHTKISFFVTAWKNNIQLILNYYQKVEGMVSAYFIDENGNKTNFSTTIKNVMFSLSENNILPSKIKINDDNSIKLFYEIKTKKEIIMPKVVIGKTIPLI